MRGNPRGHLMSSPGHLGCPGGDPGGPPRLSQGLPRHLPGPRDRYLSSCPLNMARAKFKEAEKVGDASILKMAKGLNSALEQLYGSCALNFLAILLPLPCK